MLIQNLVQPKMQHWIFGCLSLLLILGTAPAYAAPEGKVYEPEDEEYAPTPFTEYGEFDYTNEEEADAQYFQHGRFFGVSLGTGFQFVDGNRGSLWQGGFPVVDFRVHCWFDLNFAIDLGFYTAQHFYQTSVLGTQFTDVGWFQIGAHLKYYFPTKNLSAPISFANPYLIIGVGTYTKAENSNTQQTTDQDASIGINGGFGFEFTISPRKTFFTLETKVNIVTFRDTFTTLFQSAGLENLTGHFYTVTGSFLFVW